MARLQFLSTSHLFHPFTSLFLNPLQLWDRLLRRQRIIEMSTPLPRHINNQITRDMNRRTHRYMPLRREAGHHHPSIKKDEPRPRPLRMMTRATLGPGAPQGYRQAGTRQRWRRSGVNFSTKTAIRLPDLANSCVGLQCIL